VRRGVPEPFEHRLIAAPPHLCQRQRSANVRIRGTSFRATPFLKRAHRGIPHKQGRHRRRPRVGAPPDAVSGSLTRSVSPRPFGRPSFLVSFGYVCRVCAVVAARCPSYRRASSHEVIEALLFGINGDLDNLDGRCRPMGITVLLAASASPTSGTYRRQAM
jgi:hypothetical protein